MVRSTGSCGLSFLGEGFTLWCKGSGQREGVTASLFGSASVLQREQVWCRMSFSVDWTTC